MPIWAGFWRDERGAVAATVALSLVALIATGGIAFDYARLTAMDTELQNAADQAALAAASQLDGDTGACARAAAAASSLITNNTLFANDGGGLAVTVANEGTCGINDHIKFYQSYDHATDTFGDPATTDANARIVSVTVGGRTANFALTPVVGAFSSGSITATAVASMSSSICNVPPLMICVANPANFPSSTDIGKGLRLQPGPKVGAWAPGDYGYLDFGSGASGLSTNLALNSETSGCIDNSSGISTEPGNKASVTKGLNTRLDLYAAGVSTCDVSTGDYCPSQNTLKDLAFNETVDVAGTATTVPANPGCGAPGAKAGTKDTSVDTDGFTQDVSPVGFPRDTCHIADNCQDGNLGDRNWDRSAFLASAHPSTSAASIAAAMGTTASALTRWDVYRWELLDRANRLVAATHPKIGTPTYKPHGNSGNGTWTFTNRCSFPQPKNAPSGVAAGSNQKDRRILTAAAVDCSGLNGKSVAVVKGFVDLFLVEPSLDRTSPYATGKEQIYVEIVSQTKKPDGTNSYQTYLKQRPRLIR